ncbi:LPXTG cell wall anchor domain-containing protein [Alkalihalobacillus hemicellulosilyticus]|uniref:LPXTG cell wall anchor domain-containing protein n=1 Tax=Halalkalibacter hemicellulosilyticus TaxID=127886 RepID=UPI00130DDB94|nr:LPXTG cell wall anchor domain-containing protein [Halalkalibacter hemicellulosilyticus]
MRIQLKSLQVQQDQVREKEINSITNDSLPNTATNFYNLLVAGMMFVVIGFIAYVIRRRQLNLQQ